MYNKRRKRRSGKGKKKGEEASHIIIKVEAESSQEVEQQPQQLTPTSTTMSVTLNLDPEETHSPQNPSQSQSHQNTKAVGARKRKTTPISKIVEKRDGSENGCESEGEGDEPSLHNNNNNNNNSPPHAKKERASVEANTGAGRNGMIRSIVTELKSAAKEKSSKLEVVSSTTIIGKSASVSASSSLSSSTSPPLRIKVEEIEEEDEEEEAGGLKIKEEGDDLKDNRKRGNEDAKHNKARKMLKQQQNGRAGMNGWDESEEGDQSEESEEEEEGTDLRDRGRGSDQDPPFRCGVCAYGSCDKSTLIRHMRTHSGERPFQCRLCFFAFTTKANCERHLRNRHGQIDKDQVRNLVVCLPSSSESENENDISPSPPHKQPSKGNRDKFQGSLLAPEETQGINLTKSLSYDPPSAPAVVSMGFHPMNVKSYDDQPLDLSMDAVDLSTKRPAISAKRNSLRGDLLRPRPIYPIPDIPLLTSPYVSKREPTGHPQLTINPFAAHTSLRPSDLNGTLPSPFNLFPFGPPPGFANHFMIPPLEKLQPQQQSLKASSHPFIPPSPPGSFGSSEQHHTPPLSEESNGNSNSKGNDSKGSDSKSTTTASTTSPPSRKKADKGNGEFQKPKQRRYRTERPFACPHCPARFTLRSNMERHGKHQHPTVWQRSPSNRVINRQKNQQSPLIGSPTLVPPQKKFAPLVNGDGDDEGQGHGHGMKLSKGGVDVRAVIAQQLKRKLSNSSLRLENGGNDLASVSQLIDGVKSSSFAQYLRGGDDDEEEGEGDEEGDEEEEEGETEDGGSSMEEDEEEGGKRQDSSSGGEKKKSAYSSAPHKISCPHCTRRFPWTSSLRRHLLTHTGQKPFQCPQCSLLFTTKSNCDRHLARKHGGGGSGSQKTSVDGDEEGDEEEGVEEEEEEGDDDQEGDQEQEHELKTPNNRSTAVKSASTSPGEDVSFRCHLCEASATERETLLAHMESEHEETYKILVSKGALNSPVSKMSETETGSGSCVDVAHRKVICSFCVRRFWSVEDLRRHIRSHSGERPFTCPHCSRRFTLKHSMLRHLKKHGAVAEAEGEGQVQGQDQSHGHGKEKGKSGEDLIGRLLGIKDKHLVEQLLSRPDAKGAAKLLGLRRPVAAKI